MRQPRIASALAFFLLVHTATFCHADLVTLMGTSQTTFGMNPDGSVLGPFPPPLPPNSTQVYAERNFNIGPPNFDPLELRRFAVKFDLTPIPTGATINSVELLFTRTLESGSGSLLHFHGFSTSDLSLPQSPDVATNNLLATIFVNGPGSQNLGISNGSLLSFLNNATTDFIGISGRKGVGDLGAGSASIDNLRLAVNFTPTAVPEPSSMALMGIASTAILFRRWRKRK